MRKRVLITGATGNLGTKLRHHLADRYDLRLVCLNRANDPTVMTADLSRADDAWMRLFEGVDVVLHCAAQANPTAGWAEVERDNIDATLNVFEAALRGGAGRVVFMSSNWTMAGYRFGTERLTTDLPPRPTNPYGMSKVVGERIGQSFATHHGLSVICLRIGYCPARPVGKPKPFKNLSHWVQQRWISDRDFCQLVELSILASDVRFAIVNGMSNNPGMRWDLSEGRRLLGFVPFDGNATALTYSGRVRELVARVSHRLLRR